ncbi:MAG: undecaprenyldiphospho-muramoylpentapeptide beta-N-acetylglucosaminyltransferase [Bdellovibrionales bacterium]
MTYLITGGGSGGHIYPALAVADEIRLRKPDARIVLVGARRGMERKLFSKTNYKSYFLPVGQLHSSVGRRKQLISLLLMPFCFLQSLFLLLRYRPKAVLGVGGYASGPLGVMACMLRVPTYIWEANATPGITNRILGRFNTIPLLVFPEAAKFFKKNDPIMTGLPVRVEMEKERSAKGALGKKGGTTVLFVGGSQGAKVFNETVPKLIEKCGEKLEGFHFIHQTGLKNYEETIGRYPVKHNVEVLPYLDPIKAYYEAADLIVCRSGASTVVELSVMGKPSILVPFPKSADDHQRTNAESMVKKGAAMMLEEVQFNVETLCEELLSIKENPAKLSKIGAACKAAFPLGAREKIADIMLQKG